MITLVDIEKSINTVLKTNFSDIRLYASEVKEGFKRPSFFTQIIPIYFNYDTTNFTSNKVMVVINYFSENETDLENLKMASELKKAFGMILNVSSRYFTLQNIRTDIADGILQFKFDLNFFDGIEKINYHEEATDIEISIKE
jgi:translation initiation factor 1 (eIF-1/SUI1)